MHALVQFRSEKGNIYKYILVDLRVYEAWLHFRSSLTLLALNPQDFYLLCFSLLSSNTYFFFLFCSIYGMNN